MIGKQMISSLAFFGMVAYALPLYAEDDQKPVDGAGIEENLNDLDHSGKGEPLAGEQLDARQQPMQGMVMKVQIDEKGQELGDSAELRVVSGPQQLGAQEDLSQVWQQAAPIEQVGQASAELSASDSNKQRWWRGYRYPGWYRPYYYYYNYYPYYGYNWGYPYYSNYYAYPYGYRYYYWPYYW